jgi:hypothetical protein
VIGIWQIIVAIAALALFVWMLLGGKRDANDPDAVLDPDNPQQVSLLIGMTGGSIADAATAQFALRRFEEEHGRKATVKEMPIVAGMMRGGRQ